MLQPSASSHNFKGIPRNQKFPIVEKAPTHFLSPRSQKNACKFYLILILCRDALKVLEKHYGLILPDVDGK